MKKNLLVSFILSLSLLCVGQSYNFEQGQKAFNERDFETALEYFGREIKDNPKASLAYYYRAAIFFNQEKNSFALSEINNTIKYVPKNEKTLLAGAHRLRGDIYARIEEYEKTFQDYAIAEKLTPDEPELYIDRADIYFELEQYQKAEADYRKALKIDESSITAWIGLGRNYLNQKKYTEAEKTLNTLIKLAPDYNYAYKFRARLYYEQNKHNEAIEDIFYAFKLDDSDKVIRSILILYSAKNYSLAFSKVNAQIAANPEKDIWYFVRAKLNEGKRNYPSAIKDYNKVIDLSDIRFKPSILSYRADCYSNYGMYDLAIADFDFIIENDSTDASGFASRGDVKRLKGDYAGAVADFSKAIELDPTVSWLYYRRGWVKDEFMQDHNGGLQDYNEAIAIDPNYAYVYLPRGRLYETHFKNLEKAKADYTKILALDTSVTKQGNCRQYALFHLGRAEEALAWQNKIIEQYPTDGNYYDAACLLSMMDKPKESIESLKMAFENGYRDFTHLSNDDDLNKVKKLPEFVSLLQEWKIKQDEANRPESVSNSQLSESKIESFTIPMIPKGSGIYEVSCKVNDLRLNFIFDTGASDISISQTEALFMLKNGFLSPSDIGENQSYMDANGDIEIGTKVILRKLELGGFVLKNVSASVVNNKSAPLLFGQSALSKYGKILIDNQSNTITISNKR